MFIDVYERRFGREAFRLNPNLVYIHQAGFRQLNYGLEAIFSGVYGGIWMRHRVGFPENTDLQVNAITLHLGYNQSFFRIGYSYDMNVSEPWKEMSNMGAHEISFLIRLENNKKSIMNKSGAIKCPKI